MANKLPFSLQPVALPPSDLDILKREGEGGSKELMGLFGTR